MNALQINRTNRIKELLVNIKEHYKNTVLCAYEIGEILYNQRQDLEHGEYTKWIESFSIGRITLEKYIKIYQYKMSTLDNLSEAYKQIEDIETKQRQKEFAENNRKIEEYKQTGIKPSDWDRQTEYQYKKIQEYAEYLKRKEDLFNQKKKEDQERKARIEDITSAKDDIFEDLKNTFNDYEEKINSMSKNSLGNKENDFLQQNIFTAIDLYIDKFNTPSDKIMAGQNIIKHVKEVINSNHVQSVS